MFLRRSSYRDYSHEPRTKRAKISTWSVGPRSSFHNWSGLPGHGDGFINQGDQRIRRQIGELGARLAHRLVEYAPFHRIFDEFR